MRAFSTTLAISALLGLATPAMAAPTSSPSAAPSAGVTGDVRCLLTMLALASNKERQQAAQIGVYFFAGRINARAPGFDLAGAMKAQAPQMNPTEFQAEFKRCGPMIAAASRSVQQGLASLRPTGVPATPPTPPTPGPAATPALPPAAAAPHS